ncbi:asparagine synthase B [candidate division KSB1 bacterium]|nr:asparagine synthase B [candidate division KSB1 bacterium]NIR72354.1 asparagine synthase B [candidate division KSB1 bacterium]NIS23885.1 asparagine synthase B [candidate division KSB1 bacterium]NIT70802.1 asparagine synthase B [candidate division KSB1 bacterium]NIU24534.1 asparagine synthase B [candidate division KSB1 bacterium]
MCGILGIFGELEEKTHYESMLRSLKHRGPDDRGVVQADSHFLGHNRLSIVDVEKGHQPFQSKENQISLVCNGEIYNFKDLRNELGKDYPFQTNSDNEVIIPIFQRERKHAAKFLDGMFSFVLSDANSYYVARDPIGIKPLYYGTEDKCIYFASEVKALVDVAERIHEFPHGHFFHPTTRFQPYYQLPEVHNFITDEEEAIKRIQHTLRRSVRKRLMSDVPVGVFLSGGLDSSLIAALMKEEVEELHSFSVGLPNSADLKAARIVADHLGTIHHECIYSEDEMAEVLPKVIYHLESYDAALVRSAVPCYFVSRLASEFVKVILTGEGSDELFAGYSYLADYHDPDALQKESMRILNGLHNINLQRVDRMTMAHSLEGRVPFLDTDLIRTVLSISPHLKMYCTYGIEKWLLRKAFEDLLPREIVWRDKMEFAHGCGSSTVFERQAEKIPDGELHNATKRGLPLTNKEELLYYKVFQKFLDHPDMPNLIGRWQGTLH